MTSTTDNSKGTRPGHALSSQEETHEDVDEWEVYNYERFLHHPPASNKNEILFSFTHEELFGNK